MSQRQANYKTQNKYHDALDDLLDRPISFNPAFLRMINEFIADRAREEGKKYGNAASPAAAIFLSQAWYWSKRTTDPDKWFYKSAKEWEEETGLTDNTQATCRRILGIEGMQVIEEKLKSVPATVHYRVIRARVYTLLGFSQIPSPQETEIPDPQEPNIPAPNEQVPEGSGIFNKESNTTHIPPTENISIDAKKIKDTCLEILQDIGYSVFGNNMTNWWNFRRRLDDDGIVIVGDSKLMTISGLSEKIGQFTEAEVWQNKYAPSFAKLGLLISFQE
jgi:hypothetical protein